MVGVHRGIVIVAEYRTRIEALGHLWRLKPEVEDGA